MERILDSPQGLIIGAVAIFFLVAVAYGWWKSSVRKQELQAWAARQGFRFQPQKVYGLDTRYHPFDCLQKGNQRYAYNIITGHYANRPFMAFDYHFATYSQDSKGRKTTQHHYFSCLLIELPWPLKPLSIRAEHFFDRIGDFLGGGDIEFESDAFNRAFRIKAIEPQWAFDVLHQDTMELLLRSPRFAIQFGGPWILLRTEEPRRGGLLLTEDLEAALELVTGIVERFPRYLIQELSRSAQAI